MGIEDKSQITQKQYEISEDPVGDRYAGRMPSPRYKIETTNRDTTITIRQLRSDKNPIKK